MFADIRAEIGDIFRSRGANRLVYLHSDHFEPWRAPKGSVSEQNAEEIVAFGERTRRIEHARRLTLFYRTHVTPTLKPVSGAQFANGSALGFVRPSAEKSGVAASGMRPLMRHNDHALELHIHHEFVTCNRHLAQRGKFAEYLASGQSGRADDSARLALLVDLSLEAIRQETGIALRDWLFVHGNWGLNGGDRNACEIEDEIMILAQKGCVGDFTFPAAPPHTVATPHFKAPTMIRPKAAMRCYDLVECRIGEAGPHCRDGFFIWSSPLDWTECSLDYFLPEVGELAAEPAEWARRIASRALVVGGQLYFNTWAHSMNGRYWTEGAPLPHEHEGIRTMLSLLTDAMAAQGGKVEYLTARETMQDILARPDQVRAAC